jgi:hypothetical protein
MIKPVHISRAANVSGDGCGRATVVSNTGGHILHLLCRSSHDHNVSASPGDRFSRGPTDSLPRARDHGHPPV